MRLPVLTQEIVFPNVEEASPEGIVAVGGDLSLERLIAAYRQGIFPWYSVDQPILWWSPDPRGIIPLDRFHVSRSLKKVLKRNIFTVTVNHDFESVVCNCAVRPGEKNLEGWIHQEMINAYTTLHAHGYAHSVEVWRENILVGGLYGVSIGGLFAGESMFYREPNASKIALVSLVERLVHHGFSLMDCQMVTPVTTSMGAVEIGRKEYIEHLHQALERRCSFI